MKEKDYGVRRVYSHVGTNKIIKYHAEYTKQLKFTNFIQMRVGESSNKAKKALWTQHCGFALGFYSIL